MSTRILAISDFDWESNLRRRLELAGHGDDELRFMSSGSEALAAAEHDPPDLVIHDLYCLDMDGCEFAQKLKWLPSLKKVPILLVGWLSPEILYPRARRAGADGYLHGAVYSQGLANARSALLHGGTYFPPASMSSGSSEAPAGEEGRNVLVIDDTPMMAELVHMTLGRERNDAVRYASSGPKGLEAATQNPPDLIILDIMMPGWDGFETHRRISMAVGLEEVPVLFQTAYASAFQRARTQGAAGCLMSPYRSEELLAARDAALRGEQYESASG
jgi:CheY-like chemotaxis protein